MAKHKKPTLREKAEEERLDREHYVRMGTTSDPDPAGRGGRADARRPEPALPTKAVPMRASPTQAKTLMLRLKLLLDREQDRLSSLRGAQKRRMKALDKRSRAFTTAAGWCRRLDRDIELLGIHRVEFDALAERVESPGRKR